MPLDWEQVVIDARDPQALGRWWAAALDWIVTIDSHEEFEIRPTMNSTPGMIFLPVQENKTAKNRVHPDFRPQNQQAEVDRLLLMGARRADIGQGEQSWIVLLDPEGNEFCILSAHGS
ncbi:VOC family protein [Paenarthrobacter sp. Z7-10]|uniref:VOC family protein n=1 Tax=Paenarthrobacter sp. Z7-10 TaxID=2787635 RepID=UPI0022A93E34|nr:VOC family protein [Paenarthrobacter sp. Z7-10]MCZ2402863.1 VOC family protein [Paenarthrobacter sp. Z7-10]